jgi:hypothetical protein
MPAQEEPQVDPKMAQAIEILKKVDAAAKAVNSVRYKVATKPEGEAVKFFATAEGTVVQVGWAGNMAKQFHYEVRTSKAESSEARELTAGGDGETYFLIDHQAKKAYQDMDPNVIGSAGRIIRGFGMAEFVHPAPFGDEINAEKSELLGKEKIGDQECYKIHVVYTVGGQESTWYFSTKDYLPRRRIRHVTGRQGGKGTFEVTVSDLEINPKLEPGLFKLSLPDGYEQIDDFAP